MILIFLAPKESSGHLVLYYYYYYYYYYKKTVFKYLGLLGPCFFLTFS